MYMPYTPNWVQEFKALGFDVLFKRNTLGRVYEVTIMDGRHIVTGSVLTSGSDGVRAALWAEVLEYLRK